MTKTRKSRYSKQFKNEALQLLQKSERPSAEIAKELGVTEQTLNAWAAESLRQKKNKDSDSEYQKLKKEHELLKKEHEILAKALAFFAKKNA